MKVFGLRRLLGCALVAFAVVIATGCGSSPDGSSESSNADKRSSSAREAPPATRPSRPAPPRISLRRAVGAKIMTGMRGTWPSRTLLRRVRAGKVGGVLLFAPNVSERLPGAVRALRRAAKRGGGRGLIVAIDQEGGSVRRLGASPPTLSAEQMGTAGARTAFSQGRATGKALRATGINANLAPVADTHRAGGFLAERSFARSAGAVAKGACAFAGGLRKARVHATLKHFPGLGQARRNTDDFPVSLDVARGRLLEDIEPYRRCAKQAAMVMLSNAAYPTLAGPLPAAFNPAIIRGLLRERIGFRGVTISDALSAPGVAGPGAALRASRAGVDMLLYTGERLSRRGYRELLAALRAGRLSRAEVHGSARRIRALQE